MKSFAFAFFCLCQLGLAAPAQTSSPNRNFPAAIKISPAETLQQQIARISRVYGLDPRLFQSLISTESNFKRVAVSPKGAAGLAQLMPATARRFGLRVDSEIDERFNAEKCLSAGAVYLAWLLRYFGNDVRLALAGYNAGEGAVVKYGGRIPPYKETVLYVEKICARYFNQSGHGVAMAYNRLLAQNWISGLYRTRGADDNRSARNITPAVSSPAPQILMPGTAATDVSPVILSPQSAVIKKTIVTRVASEEMAPRIRTQSLSFGNY